jgi:hypothetical protein
MLAAGRSQAAGPRGCVCLLKGCSADQRLAALGSGPRGDRKRKRGGEKEGEGRGEKGRVCVGYQTFMGLSNVIKRLLLLFVCLCVCVCVCVCERERERKKER